MFLVMVVLGLVFERMTTRNAFIWHDPPNTKPTLALTAQIGGHPLVAQVLCQRGYAEPAAALAFLHADHYSPTPPAVLPDLVQTAERLRHAIRQRERILIWGDFDVDGQTATALLLNGLRRLGADVGFYIPNRLRESHGIRLESLQQQFQAVKPAALLTCDTGVSEHRSIDYTKSQGVTALITDHHDLPPSLPNADAIVNPKRLPTDHPLASLPGVGVVYKLMEDLYTQADLSDELPDLLDLVALGIVADVATQTHDTRYLLQIGLDRLRNTQRVGLSALIEIAGLNPIKINTTDIGFQLGPRLNAAGRLDDASQVVDLLTTTNPSQAHLIALQLEGLNNQRRLQNRQIYEAAQEMIARDSSLLDWEALVLSHPNWHPGIIGIVASRLADHYQRPVVLLTTGDDGTARGSARSVPGYDIGAAIAAQADLLLHHGGHPGAAGLSLDENKIPQFRRRLSNTLHDTFNATVKRGIQLDAFVTLDELSLDLAAELNRLAPFGEGNPRITLATRDLTLKSAAYIGRGQLHRRLIVEDSQGNRQHVLWWNSADQQPPEGQFDLAYELEINTYQDQAELQLVLVDFRPSENAPVVIRAAQPEIIDYRDSANPADTLALLRRDYPEASVWAEGYRRAESPGQPLSKLHEAPTLIVYTTPTGPQPLKTALNHVKPQRIVLLGVAPSFVSVSDVLGRIGQLVRYVLDQQAGRTTITELAEAVAHSPTTIRLTLDIIAAQHALHIDYRRGGSVIIEPTQPPATGAPDDDQLAALQTSLAETAAYRAYFHRAAPVHLLGFDATP